MKDGQGLDSGHAADLTQDQRGALQTDHLPEGKLAFQLRDPTVASAFRFVPPGSS